MNTNYLLVEEQEKQERDETYDMAFVMKRIPKVLKREFLDIEKSFQSYNLISFDEVCSYIESHVDLMAESKFGKVDPQEIIEKRKDDYQYFKECIEILASKGIKLIQIFNYLNGFRKYQDQKIDEDYEDFFKRLNFIHVGSAMSGRDLNQMLIVLSHIIDQFDENLRRINDLTTYHTQVIDSFAKNYGGRRIYPYPELILEIKNTPDSENTLASENTKDKTSFHLVEDNPIFPHKRMRTKN